MRVHHLQHVPFEGLGSIESVLKAKGHQLSSTQLYDNQSLPSVDDIDWLIVMGGPMSIYQEESHPWLSAEKRFIKQAIDSGKIVLGICLGAQLIADVLGAKVHKNNDTEIGWFNINRLPEASDTILSTVLPVQSEVFHWHGDTFEIPENAIALAESKACKNQGFIVDDRIVALQFHLEMTWETATVLTEQFRDQLEESKYIQSAQEILSNTQGFSGTNQIMVSVLNALESNNV